MRNKKEEENLSENIISLVTKLPYFGIDNLKILKLSPNYLRIILFRLAKRGEIIRLKKGIYASKKMVERMEKENKFSSFLEFLAVKIYSPAYLSLEYVLYENNILTEMPKNFTLITKNKTATFLNRFGVFIYHKLKDKLFLGFTIERANNLLIYKATKAKALFDFLYLRKREILNKEMARELRLNLGEFRPKEKKELKSYVDLEGSKKMREIYSFLFR